MRPIAETRCSPVPGEITARHRVDDQSSVGGTRPTVYGWACGTVDRTLIGDLADRRGVGSSAWDISLVNLSIDAEVGYETVCVCGRDEGEGGGEEREEEGGGLH
jgi:hypothetical protein